MSTDSELRRLSRRMSEYESEIRRLHENSDRVDEILFGLVSTQVDQSLLIQDLIAVINVILDRLPDEES